jgi:hypothetical protein
MTKACGNIKKHHPLAFQPLVIECHYHARKKDTTSLNIPGKLHLIYSGTALTLPQLYALLEGMFSLPTPASFTDLSPEDCLRSVQRLVTNVN